MNILFLDSIERGTFGGVEAWIGLVSAGLSKRGHTITVAGRIGSEFLRRTAITAPNVSLLPLPISGDFDLYTIFRLRRELAKRKIDVVVPVFNKDVRLGGIAARLRGKTRVIWRLGINLTRKNVWHRMLTPKLIDGIVTPSESLKQEILGCGYISADDVTVIPTGLPDVRNALNNGDNRERLLKQYGLPQEAIIAVTSGRFVNQKGHQYLIDAAPDIVAAFPEVVFLLLGDGPLEASLRKKIDTMGLRRSFLFAGMLDNPEKELAGADLMVHPSVVEPFGIAVLEGMRAGLPIVASRVGGIPEVVDEPENAVLVPSRDPSALSKAVISVLEDRARMKAMGAASRERWHTIFRYDGMLNKIEQVLGGKR